MKEFIDKLISRLEEEKKDANYWSCLEEDYFGGKEYAFEEAISIVNQLAEEYINTSTISKMETVGWIPCSERLPELTEGTECFKQSKCCLTTLKWWDGDMTESVGWYNQSGVWNEDSKNCKVVAWMPLPAPYQQKEGE